MLLNFARLYNKLSSRSSDTGGGGKMVCGNEKCDRWCNEYANNCCEFASDDLPLICRFFLTNDQTPVAEVPCGDGLDGLLQCKPQVAKEHYGPEPSLYSLLVDYYTEHDMEPEEAIANYIVALKRQAL
jgi:hypothetical protein